MDNKNKIKFRDLKSVSQRRQTLESALGITLPHIGSFSLDENSASNRNCENMIGVSQIPLGVAGPLCLRSGENHDLGEYYVPLATTEGALVASVNRGCKALSENGVVVLLKNTGVTRGSVFRVESLYEGQKLDEAIHKSLDELKKITKSTSDHLSLMEILVRPIARYVFVRFSFDSQEAMGMNMATVAATKIADYLSGKFGCRSLAVAGNFDIDKKPAWLNFIENRGRAILAEATISSAILQNVLKTTAREMYDVWLAKCMVGSAMSGSLGFNAQYANIAAAFFAAAGQDLGHVGEASMGITTLQPDGENLNISIYLPDCLVGVVGGGTGLETQRESLRIMGIRAGDNGAGADLLARVFGGAVLAGELSLLASLSEGTLATAHQKLARGKNI